MWKNIALVPAALLVAFIACEAVARLWIPLPDAYPLAPGLLVHDNRSFWLPMPGYKGVMDNRVDFQGKTLTINPDGSRFVPCAPVSETAGRRIYLLGDSQTFGFGLGDDETWANRLQCGLSQSGAKARKVLNLGVHATNIDQYVTRGLSQVAGAAAKGDLVIVGVTWNDLISPQSDVTIATARAHAERIPPGETPHAVQLTEPLRMLSPPTWRYRLYRWSGLLVPAFSSLKTFAESLQFSSVLAHVAIPKLKLLHYRFRAEDTFVNKLDPDAVENNMTLLSVLQGAVARHGGRMIVYFLPNRLFFDDAYYASYSAGGKIFPARDYMSHLARPYCEKFALTCVTAFDALRTAGPDTYTFGFDGHYNEAGAGVVAARLQSYLERECVADGRPCLLLED